IRSWLRRANPEKQVCRYACLCYFVRSQPSRTDISVCRNAFMTGKNWFSILKLRICRGLYEDEQHIPARGHVIASLTCSDLASRSLQFRSRHRPESKRKQTGRHFPEESSVSCDRPG